MTCTLLIPPDGLMELWNYPRTGREVLTDRGLGDVGVVQVHLLVDNTGVGSASWNIVVDLPINKRGGAAIEYLCGSHVQITGPVVLEGLNERAAIEIMQEVT